MDPAERRAYGENKTKLLFKKKYYEKQPRNKRNVIVIINPNAGEIENLKTIFLNHATHDWSSFLTTQLLL